MTTYTLAVKNTNNKKAPYHYSVINDQTGEVLAERKSSREYVACTINGQYYFGRLDLIGKGEHGWQIKLNEKYGKPQVPIAYRK